MNKFFRVLAISVIATASFATTSALAGEVIIERYTEIATVTSKPVNSSQVAKALSNCSSARGWVFSNAGGGKLLGKLVVRGKHYVAVKVDYNSEAYKISYQDSKNMKYDAESNTIHKRYNSWVKNLDDDVRFCLTTLDE